MSLLARKSVSRVVKQVRHKTACAAIGLARGLKDEETKVILLKENKGADQPAQIYMFSWHDLFEILCFC